MSERFYNESGNENKCGEDEVSRVTSFITDLEVNLNMEAEAVLAEIKQEEYLLLQNEIALKETEKMQDRNRNIFSPNTNLNDLQDVMKYKEQEEELKKKITDLRDKYKVHKERLKEFLYLKQYLCSRASRDVVRDAEPIQQENKQIEAKEDISYETMFVEMQEMDRNRIARDLHDTSMQTITNLTHKCELCMKLIDMDPIRAKLELQIMSEQIRSTITEIREIIYDLRPMSIDNIGLVPAVDSFCDKIAAGSRIHFNKRISITDESDIPTLKKISTFRIIQEACNNIVKHAKAQNVTVILNKADNQLFIEVSDDGVGFTYKDTSIHNDGTQGFGLQIMRERTLLLSGKFEVRTKEGEGTRICVSIPVTNTRGKVE